MLCGRICFSHSFKVKKSQQSSLNYRCVDDCVAGPDLCALYVLFCLVLVAAQR